MCRVMTWRCDLSCDDICLETSCYSGVSCSIVLLKVLCCSCVWLEHSVAVPG